MRIMVLPLLSTKVDTIRSKFSNVVHAYLVLYPFIRATALPQSPALGGGWNMVWPGLDQGRAGPRWGGHQWQPIQGIDTHLCNGLGGTLNFYSLQPKELNKVWILVLVLMNWSCVRVCGEDLIGWLKFTRLHGWETFLGDPDNPGIEAWKVKVERGKMDVMREKDGKDGRLWG